MTAETCARISAGHIGLRRTPETRAKIAAKATGRTWSPEMKHRLREAHLGNVPSPETKAKLSEAHRGEKHWNWQGGISKVPFRTRWSTDPSFRARRFGYDNRRRALKFSGGGSHTPQEWQEKIELLGGVCIYCGEAKPLFRDHNVPLTRGGSDDIANILPACKPCNSRKFTLTAREYLARKVA